MCKVICSCKVVSQPPFIGGVIHGSELKSYFIILTYHGIYTEMNIVNNGMNPVVLVTIKDVSARQGTLELYDAVTLEGCDTDVWNFE